MGGEFVGSGDVVIPSGMTPMFMHSVGGRLVVHVKGWTARGAYEGNTYDLYPLDSLEHIALTLKHEGSSEIQDWYLGFGKPTKIARRGPNSELTIRDRVADE